MAWPCPTRRLCDEADEGPSPWKAAINMALDRDRWRADAERLAAAARRVSDDYRSVARGTSGINDLCSALAAHDALVDGAGQ
jgi:hypothetical protein